ncbi:MAG: winged helix-turn-helix transcriptional regulator [Candidatus Lokiarchaeota archaeon]|nr:winged helix-turn-helix transcriptional regulator [Candidatus Lokiarchaeota archaeon]
MDELTKASAEFLKILSDPFKLGIVKYLKKGRKTAKDIELALNISQSYTSQQLKQLERADMIFHDRENNLKYYHIRNHNIFRVISAINSYVIEQHKNKYTKLSDSNNIDILK